MARPTINPRGNNIAGAYIDGQIRGPALGTDSVGLTQAATAIQRNLTVASLGITPATGQIPTVFRGPPSGATLLAAHVSPGAAQPHAVNSTQTWAFMLKNRTTGNDLQVNGASLSNITLAATAFKTIPLDNGNSTILSGHTLGLSMGISGSPAAMEKPVIVLEWTPTANS